MTSNPGRGHLISSTDNIIAENQTINNSQCEKVLSVTLDSKLTFDDHINDICKKRQALN